MKIQLEDKEQTPHTNRACTIVLYDRMLSQDLLVSFLKLPALPSKEHTEQRTT